MNKKLSEEDQEKTIEGTVAARKCDCCDHHEIGIVTQVGKYIPLKPGMRVKIIREVKC